MEKVIQMKPVTLIIGMILLSAISSLSFASDLIWGSPQLLPFTVNDHEPIISWHGDYLFFWDYIGNDHMMYYSPKIGESWGPMHQIGPPIWQPPEPCYTPSLTSDYLHLYFGTRRNESGFDWAIYMSDCSGSSWSEAYLFYWWDPPSGGENNAAIPDSLDEIFFHTTFSGSQSDTGIYWAKKVAGVWQPPVFLGPTINPPTAGFTGVPFVTPDGQRLYFSDEIPIDPSLERMYYSDRLGETAWGPRVAILPNQPAQNPSVDMYGNLYFTNPTNWLHYWAPLINVKVEPISLGNIKALYHQ